MRTLQEALPAAVLLAGALCPLAAQDAALIAKARGIHERVLTLDTHKDISPLLAKEAPADSESRDEFLRRYDPAVDGAQQVDFPKMRRGGLDCAFFIVYVGQGRNDGAGFARALDQAMAKFDAIHRMCRRYPDEIGLARTPDDVLRLSREGKLIACIGIENGYPMGLDPSRVERFWELGARYMSIAHNRHSQLGDSHTPAEPLHNGLTDLGRQAIAEMNRVGIMVDISHASKTSMMQAIELSKAPVIASHSGCRAVCDHTRNLDDEQLLALKQNGGVIQIVALGSFIKDARPRNAALAELQKEIGLPPRSEWRDASEKLGEKFDAMVDEYDRRSEEVRKRFPDADVSVLADHVDYAVKLIGVDHVAISSDFDGGGGIDGWRNAAETFNVTLELVKRGYTEEQIGKIWSGNTLRLWRDVEAVAAKIQSAKK